MASTQNTLDTPITVNIITIMIAVAGTIMLLVRSKRLLDIIFEFIQIVEGLTFGWSLQTLSANSIHSAKDGVDNFSRIRKSSGRLFLKDPCT